MRVSDIMLQTTYLSSINRTKEKMQDLQEKAATGKKVQNPSDSPFGTVTILSLQDRISSAKTNIRNMESIKGFLQETENNLNSIESEITKILNNISLARSTTAADLKNYGDQLDLALKTIIDTANSQYEGKYLFAGTDYTTAPYGFTTDGLSVEIKAQSVAGEQKISISQDAQQKVNITGTELFGTIIKQRGDFDSTAAIGTVTTGNSTIYDAEGNEYTLNVSYEKTAANTYELTYDILDDTSTSIYGTAPAAITLGFNSTSGRLSTVNGSETQSINIKDASHKLDFNLDFVSLKESSSASALSFSANQNVDIFNMLIQIRDDLLAGNKPSDAQFDAVKNFHQHVLDKLSQNGNIVSRFEDTIELLDNRVLSLQELLSNEQDIDEAEVIMSLQNEDYQLQLAYKLSSMILQKSLLDYL